MADLPGSSASTVHRWAVATVVCTLVLIAAGALVTSRDAGLAVPDWPLSFGTVNPPRWYAIENVRTEHGHRVAAFCVAVLTVMLGLRIRRHERRKIVRRLGAAAVAAVLLQAVLGGLRVLHLSLDLAMVHGWLGQAFFCIVVAIATITSPHWSRCEDEPPRPTPAVRVGVLAAALLASVVCQLVLGIIVRHMGPSAGALAANGVFHAHIGVAALIAWLSLRFHSALQADAALGRGHRLTRRARVLVGLVWGQVALGAATFAVTAVMQSDRQATLAEAWVPTLHVALGAAVLGVSINLALHCWAMRKRPSAERVRGGRIELAGA